MCGEGEGVLNRSFSGPKFPLRQIVQTARVIWGWEGKTGSICHFAFSLVLQCLEVPTYPDAGKTARKMSLSRPFLCVPNASKN